MSQTHIKLNSMLKWKFTGETQLVLELICSMLFNNSMYTL